MIVTIYHTFLLNIQEDSTYVVIMNMVGGNLIFINP